MISRKKLLEELEAWKERLGVSSPEVAAKIMIKAFIDKVNAQPEEDVTDINVGNKWIQVSERLPDEHDSIFAKAKGTDKWNNAMFEKISDEVNVTYEYPDGTRKAGTSHTLDGKWHSEKTGIKKKVVAWQPLPEPYKGE